MLTPYIQATIYTCFQLTPYMNAPAHKDWPFGAELGEVIVIARVTREAIVKATAAADTPLQIKSFETVGILRFSNITLGCRISGCGDSHSWLHGIVQHSNLCGHFLRVQSPELRESLEPTSPRDCPSECDLEAQRPIWRLSARESWSTLPD